MSPEEYDAIMSHLVGLEQQIHTAVRTLGLMRPNPDAKPVEDNRERPARVHKTFGGREHHVPLSPDEVAAQATAPAARQGYISRESQGDSGLATSGKADGVEQKA